MEWNKSNPTRSQKGRCSRQMNLAVVLTLLLLGAPATAQNVPGTDLSVTGLVVVVVLVTVVVCALLFAWLFFCYYICKTRREYRRVKERIRQNAVSERARQQWQQRQLRMVEGEDHNRLAEDGTQQGQSPARLGHTHFPPTSLSSLARSPSTDFPFLNPHQQHSTPIHSGTPSPLHVHFPDTSGISGTRTQNPVPDSNSRSEQVGFAFPNHLEPRLPHSRSLDPVPYHPYSRNELPSRHAPTSVASGSQHLGFPSHSHSSGALTSHQPPYPPPGHHPPPGAGPSSPFPMSPYHGQLRSVREDEEMDVEPEPEDPPRYSRLYPRGGSRSVPVSPARYASPSSPFSFQSHPLATAPPGRKQQWGRSSHNAKDSMAEFSQLSSWPQFT